ncbi:MAG: HIT domain-containing protein, partial [bacterium]
IGSFAMPWYYTVMTDCIFCKIVEGSIPSYKIYEDEKYLAFLDVFPKTSYQMLVIPKQHIEWVWDLPAGRQVSPNLGEYYEVVGKIARHVREVSGEPVRQMVYGFQVPHAHIQLRPGQKNDRDGTKASEAELGEWQKRFSLN